MVHCLDKKTREISYEKFKFQSPKPTNGMIQFRSLCHYDEYRIGCKEFPVSETASA